MAVKSLQPGDKKWYHMGMRIRNHTNNSSFFAGVERTDAALLFLALSMVVVIGRLFMLMVLQHDVYKGLAAGSHELYAQLFPERGAVYMQNSTSGALLPLAMNKDTYLVFADTREITSDEEAEDVAQQLAELFGYDEEKKFSVFLAVNKRNDPYEPIEQEVEEEVAEKIRELHLPGIGLVRRQRRYYPEGDLASHVIGFVGKNEDGSPIGRYGVEGYWNEDLAGRPGFFEGIRSAKGTHIPLAGKLFEEAEDGADLVLTIDRTVQHQACTMLAAAAKTYEAQSASLVMMKPQTGAILAMCNVPAFDPNVYNQVGDISVYNNHSIFTPYEPGSIFKPITMAAAIDQEVLTPNSVYHDVGRIDANCTKDIQNADLKVYGDQSMTGVLENSINTGMVYVAQQLGKERFTTYLEQFGFGVKQGIPLDTEASGTIDSLYEKKGDAIDCYAATASFGQGITVTPLQMVTAFSAIANGGTLMKPYVVKEVLRADGRIERTQPEELRRVLSTRAASLVSGMMVSVVDSGHAGGAGVPGYYVAGKTGTAQIAGRGGYTQDTNHSFIGFAPVDEPAFVMIVKFEKPKVRFSASTAAPTFGKIANFALNYYGVQPSR